MYLLQNLVEIAGLLTSVVALGPIHPSLGGILFRREREEDNGDKSCRLLPISLPNLPLRILKLCRSKTIWLPKAMSENQDWDLDLD